MVQVVILNKQLSKSSSKMIKLHKIDDFLPNDDLNFMMNSLNMKTNFKFKIFKVV